MPTFRVTLGSLPPPAQGNPFLRSLPSPQIPPEQQSFPRTYREWDIEAENESAVMRYYSQAQQKGLANVLGFELVSISQVLAESPDDRRPPEHRGIPASAF